VPLGIGPDSTGLGLLPDIVFDVRPEFSRGFPFHFGEPVAPQGTVYEGTGKADFAVFTPDVSGGMQYIYQTSQTGVGAVLDFATVTDLALMAPTYLIARKVRGS
jgi:hypothetical protein